MYIYSSTGAKWKTKYTFFLLLPTHCQFAMIGSILNRFGELLWCLWYIHCFVPGKGDWCWCLNLAVINEHIDYYSIWKHEIIQLQYFPFHQCYYDNTSRKAVNTLNAVRIYQQSYCMLPSNQCNTNSAILSRTVLKLHPALLMWYSCWFTYSARSQ